MSYILALDQGTTSSRAILFDRSGSIAAVAQKEFEQFYPQAAWVEHDPMEILTSQMACAVEALGKAGARPRDVAAIGITNQRETTIVWERATSKPIYPAIVWQDRRTAALCAELERDGAGETVSAKTGLVIDPYFSATKVAWILDNVAGAQAKAERGELAFGTVDSWLIWNLTSGQRHVTDVHQRLAAPCSTTSSKADWDDELLKLLDIPAAHDAGGAAGPATRCGEVTTSLGLGDVPIAGIAGDQQAALFGQLCCLARAMRRTPTAPAVFCLRTSATNPAVSNHRLHYDAGLAASTRSSSMRSRAASSWRRGGPVAARQLRFFVQSPDVEALAASVRRRGRSSSSPPSPGSARRTGTPMRGA